MLATPRRPEGATVAQTAEAMAWRPHTVRAFLIPLGKKGMRVQVVERIRQLGPDKAGAKDSYSIYWLADEVWS